MLPDVVGGSGSARSCAEPWRRCRCPRRRCRRPAAARGVGRRQLVVLEQQRRRPPGARSGARRELNRSTSWLAHPARKCGLAASSRATRSTTSGSASRGPISARNWVRNRRLSVLQSPSSSRTAGSVKTSHSRFRSAAGTVGDARVEALVGPVPADDRPARGDHVRRGGAAARPAAAARGRACRSGAPAGTRRRARRAGGRTRARRATSAACGPSASTTCARAGCPGPAPATCTRCGSRRTAARPPRGAGRGCGGAAGRQPRLAGSS